MLAQIRFRVTAIYVAAMVVLGVFVGVGSASAQCKPDSVNSGLALAVNLTLVDNTVMPAATATMSIPPGAGTPFPLPPGFTITGINGATGVYHPFPAQPPSPACATTGTTANACIALAVTTPPPTVLCAVVCYDATTCTITLTPCPPQNCTP